MFEAGGAAHQPFLIDILLVLHCLGGLAIGMHFLDWIIVAVILHSFIRLNDVGRSQGLPRFERFRLKCHAPGELRHHQACSW